MFGFIKKLIGGIFAFISGFFSSKKDSGYFLELDEAKNDAQAIAKTAAPTSEKPKAAPAKAEATSTPAQPAKVESVKAEPVKAAPAKAEPAKADPIKAVAQSTNGAKPAVATTPAPTATAAFASTATVPNTFGNRRRPGANMDYFLDMARQAKVPS